MITRNAIKSKRNTLHVSTTEAKKEEGTAKNQAKETETEKRKLRADIEDRDRTIGRLQQERDQLSVDKFVLEVSVGGGSAQFTYFGISPR